MFGDIESNPGLSRTPKYPCKECSKSVRSNKDALLCIMGDTWSHTKCLNMSKVTFKYYLDNPNILIGYVHSALYRWEMSSICLIQRLLMVKRSVTLFHRYTPVIKWRNSMMTTYKTLLVSLPVLPKTSDNNRWNGPGKTQPSSLQHEHEGNKMFYWHH